MVYNSLEIESEPIRSGPKFNATPRISVCICTMNRPEILRRCLESIAAGHTQPDEIIVADDSEYPESVESVCRDFPHTQCIRGPRRGLCANRNTAIRACSGDFVTLADDDAVFSADFLTHSAKLASQARAQTIFTGDVLEDGHCLTPPSNPTFWGHFSGKASPRLETIHLNCNLFPRSAFDIAQFDEQIKYGYEDMDLCSHLIVQGYLIEYHPELVNQHNPPAKNQTIADERSRQSDQARYYTSLKRYFRWQRKPIKAIVYIITAPLHQALHHFRKREYSQISTGFSEVIWAVREIIGKN
jgi:glycosyltransferase involved in cell wall biosynthesis